jgi:hypothetical protein
MRNKICLVFSAAIFTMSLSGCEKSKEQEDAEHKAFVEASEKSAMICAQKVAINIDLVDPATKQIVDYLVCPVDFMSGNIVCPSKNGSIKFLTSLPFEIPTKPKYKYPSVKFAINYRGESLKFYCWLDNGYPIHIVRPKNGGGGKQDLIDGNVVYSMVPNK